MTEHLKENIPITWAQFELDVSKKAEAARNVQADKDYIFHHSNWIFRGQPNADWSLDTSLERFLQQKKLSQNGALRADLYYDYVNHVIPAINSLTGKNFKLVPTNELATKGGLFSWKSAEVLLHLRHLGFPSPILDWSSSYYVAAYFAFRGSTSENDVAIFAFQDHFSKLKSWGHDDPLIQAGFEIAETHPRHFSQQGVYTVCTKALVHESTASPIFYNHSAAAEINKRNHKLCKYIIKGSERDTVLRALSNMNINEYTLFGSEEGLVHMLAHRHCADVWRQ